MLLVGYRGDIQPTPLCPLTECYEEALFVTQLQNEHKISFMSSLRAYKSTYGMLLELAS